MIARLCGLAVDARVQRRDDLRALARTSRWVAGNAIGLRGRRLFSCGALPDEPWLARVRVGGFGELLAGLAVAPALLAAEDLPARWRFGLRLLGVPMLYHEWWVVALFYLFVTGMIGVFLTVVFQLAHCVEEAEFPAPADTTMQMEDAWAVHQVETTVDFARDNRFLTWILGGLNFQIVHHLFPRICHIHYPALSRIVEQTCNEYGVRYAVHPTFMAGVRSHYRWLKRMGRAPAVLVNEPVPA